MTNAHLEDLSPIDYDRNCNTTLYQTRQERRVKRYLDPWINVHYPKGDTTPRISETTLRQRKHHENPFVPRSSPDVNLTAFAQLGSLRLCARRAAISLVGREDQYVLAEATQTISLQSDTVYAQEDDLWFGHCVLPCSVTICGYAMARFRAEYATRQAEKKTLPTASMNEEHMLPSYDPIIIADIFEDEHCRGLSVHAIPGNAKSYAAVPILASTGHIIGIYEVYDDTPRQLLEPQQLQFLRDMAITVSKHLVTTSARVLQSRGERLVKGLALFMEGKSSLRQWFVEEGYKNRLDLNELHSNEGRTVSNEADEQYGPAHRMGRSGSHASRSPSVSSAASTDHTRATKSQKLVPKGHEHRRSVSSVESHLAVPSKKDTNAHRLSSSSLHEQVNTAFEDNENSDDNLITRDMRSLFSRASNLIREACGVDGVMVYDASDMQHWEPAKSQDANRHMAMDEKDATNYTSENSDSDSPESTRSEDFTTAEICKILGFSVTAKSSLAGNSASRHHLSLRRRVLKSLMERYPRGKVFHFDEGESLSSSEEVDLKIKDSRRHGRMLREQKCINDIIGGAANSVAFFPLWDWYRNRWFAGIFAWTTSSSRMLESKDDLPYLKAFGNSIMTELARLDASTSDRAKAKFISSISHELRSPLHGILAGSELLLTTIPTGFESNLVTTIENCGKTLLDTVNHLLEYSKISSTNSSIIRKAKAERRGRKASNATEDLEAEAEDPEDCTDLEQVTEEVLETLLLGLTSNPAHPDMQSGAGHGSGTDLDSYKRFPYIVFDIDYTKPWFFRLSPGSWRRIVMNLVGNSMKFTKNGYVRLELKHPVAGDDGGEGDVLTLVVEDTGKGINEEFLRHQLYTPFVQEDILSPGTGLGLHLTRQIVQDLHGKITASSTVGRGSKFKIELPLHRLRAPNNEEEQMTDSRFFMRERMRDRTLALIACKPSNADEDRAKGFSLVTDTLALLFHDWFNMKIKRVQGLKEASADVIVMTDEHFRDLIDTKDFNHFIASSTDDNVVRRLMVLCYNLHFAARASQKYTHVQFVTPPFGSKSISKALGNFFSETIEEGKAKGRDDPKSQSKSDEQARLHEQTPPPPSKPTTHSSPLSESFPSPISEFGSFDEMLKSRARLLLVEDNEINMRFLVTFAKRNNLRYSCAQNGLEAVEAYKTAGADHFDVIVMDISMPIMDGLSATREIRRFERGKASSSTTTSSSSQNTTTTTAAGTSTTPRKAHIIALTGVTSDSARQDAFGAGVDLFLTKPAPLRQLKTIVDEFVRERDRRREAERVWGEENAERGEGKEKEAEKSEG